MSFTGFLTFLIVIGVIILAHELGHFLLARWVGVSVLKFSIGFGPKLYSFQKGETEYQLSSIPFGGYVKLLGDDPEQELTPEEKKRAFLTQKTWKKAAIVAAGPIFNIIFAYFVFTSVYLIGVPQLEPRVGKVEEGSPAAEAGVKQGDLIQKIGDNDIIYWDDIRLEIQLAKGAATPFVVKRDGSDVTLAIQAKSKQVEDIFNETQTVWLIGIMPDGSTVTQKFNPFEAVYIGFNKTADMLYLTVLGLVKTVQGTVPRENIGGPILIAQMASKNAEEGILNVLMFIGILSINLGIINLFPIPVLDGGHLVFFAIEGIIGHEISIRKKEIAQQVGLVLLASLMIYVFKNDFVRLYKGTGY